MNRHRQAGWTLAGAVLITAMGVRLLAAPALSAKGFRYGLELCAGSVLPALFPFFVICNLLAAGPAAAMLGHPLRPLARLLGLGTSDDSALALALSWLGGYAVCARMLQQLRQRGTLDGTQLERLLILGFCSGPGFVIGCMGGLLLGSVRTGVLLYGMQLAANLLAAATWALLKQPAAAFVPRPETAMPCAEMGLSAAIGAAVDASLQVCGCTLFFCVLAAQLQPLLPALPLAWPLLGAELEISTGSAAFSALGGADALYGMCLCLSLPGLSVFCQVQALMHGRVPWRALLFSRLLHLFWMQLLMRLAVRCLPGTLAVFSTLQERVIALYRLPPDAAVICFIFLCCTLYKLRQTFYNRPSSLR